MFVSESIHFRGLCFYDLLTVTEFFVALCASRVEVFRVFLGVNEIREQLNGASSGLSSNAMKKHFSEEFLLKAFFEHSIIVE